MEMTAFNGKLERSKDKFSLPDIDANFLHYIDKAARVATVPITFICLHNCVSLLLYTHRLHVGER